MSDKISRYYMAWWNYVAGIRDTHPDRIFGDFSPATYFLLFKHFSSLYIRRIWVSSSRSGATLSVLHVFKRAFARSSGNDIAIYSPEHV
jgi:hypothetical protein